MKNTITEQVTLHTLYLILYDMALIPLLNVAKLHLYMGWFWLMVQIMKLQVLKPER